MFFVFFSGSLHTKSSITMRLLQKLPNLLNTVKHLIFVMSNFHVLMKMTYQCILILAFMIYYGSR